MSDPPPISDVLTPREEAAVRGALVRVRLQGLGIAMGLLCGFGLFAATNLLILRGGQNIGAHLGLLAAYFPGYSVTFGGSLIGLLYAGLFGYVIGRTIGFLYNRLVEIVGA